MINFNINCDLVNMLKECQTRRKLICDLEKKFQELEDERNKLREKMNARNRDISNAEDRGMTPTDTLTGWFGRVQRMEQELELILGTEEHPHQLPDKCLGRCCYSRKDFKSACELANSVAENLLKLKALREEQLQEADMFTRASVDDLPVDEMLGMDSKFEEVWDCLDEESQRQHHPRIIRICGMGGVGKTALLKRVHNEFRIKKIGFNLVIWVDAAYSSDVQSVQLAIGEKLGLTWPETAKQQTRATNINVALKKKKFVLFIDDPHKDLTLTNVGVPTHSNKINKYKIVFATKDEAVSLGMGGDQYHRIKVDRLETKYAEALFNKTVGMEVLNSHPAIPSLAKSVTELCDGLPLTLITVGLAMTTKRTPEDWEHAEVMLTNLAHQFGGMEKVYEKFHVSYDGLSETVQRCFLYCSLFPKEALVGPEQLIDYWIGESFLKESPALKEIRNQGYNIISTLKAANLLESGTDDEIRMHDTIRGSALWIAAECGKAEDKFWVRSRAELAELPKMNWAAVQRISLVRSEVKRLNKSRCSKLSTLILKRSKFWEISSGFFQQMSSLKVLDLSWSNLDKFPADITTLTALQYLNLSHTYISELPGNFKNLTELKILDLSFIPGLQKIPSKVIRSLSKLQVLNIYRSGFENQINKGSVLFGNGDALLDELKHLHHLQDLRITVTSAVGLRYFWKCTKLNCTQKLFITNCKASTSLQLPPPAENMENLKMIHVFECPDLDELWDKKEKDMSAADLRHGSEIRLEARFGNISHVEIERCWIMKNLTWLKWAPNLQSLKVAKCAKMEEVISDGDEGSSSGAGREQDQLFSNLRYIHLSELPELKSICNKILPLPLLEEITVLYCPQIVKLPLDPNSPKKKLKLIRGHEKWWDKLQWDGRAVKRFSTYFKSE